MHVHQHEYSLLVDTCIQMSSLPQHQTVKLIGMTYFICWAITQNEWNSCTCLRGTLYASKFTYTHNSWQTLNSRAGRNQTSPHSRFEIVKGSVRKSWRGAGGICWGGPGLDHLVTKSDISGRKKDRREEKWRWGLMHKQRNHFGGYYCWGLFYLVSRKRPRQRREWGGGKGEALAVWTATPKGQAPLQCPCKGIPREHTQTVTGHNIHTLMYAHSCVSGSRLTGKRTKRGRAFFRPALKKTSFNSHTCKFCSPPPLFGRVPTSGGRVSV